MQKLWAQKFQTLINLIAGNICLTHISDFVMFD